LMFTNAGMNQFKDIFLGNAPAGSPRVADSQKCLRVSGKHNDLEEVGHDTYHHTMFEMLGNWSFGDYFKQDSIDWAWELLTHVFQIDKDRLYATVFEGDPHEDLLPDDEAKALWMKYLPEERIVNGSKKDNFWEMGDQGPCGPCSEIHIDLRPQHERDELPGQFVVNNDHPQVIEIWNLVFIQFNRKSDGQLEALPSKHVDTGMGFERLVRVIQGKSSNYDSDLFTPIIGHISRISGLAYGHDAKADVAMRVVADHLRTVSFSIADGQIPSNNKAGYVIRRILRRAVRYGYTFLKLEQPFIHELIPTLIQVMGEAYPELVAQKDLIEKVIHEEEATFLKTLETGIKLLDNLVAHAREQGQQRLDGHEAFRLYDTFGFPLDLTELILRDHGMTVHREQFDQAMAEQKNRSQSAAQTQTDDWQIVHAETSQSFVGYDRTQADLQITRFRKVAAKGRELFQLVFNFTPFYGESGGQVGDTGFIQHGDERVQIVDTQKENNLIVHLVEQLPSDPSAKFHAVVDPRKRQLTACNHSATHLLHQALREVLGHHVEQKGSLVDEHKLRFDFSHFQKMTAQELRRVEELVNQRVRMNLPLDEKRETPIEEARQMGAMALFGEKYGDIVRVIRFGASVELCGGTHVKATGEIGLFKIVAETAIAAGIRRVEAITAEAAQAYAFEQIDLAQQAQALFKGGARDLVQAISALQTENQDMRKQIEAIQKQKANLLRQNLLKNMRREEGVNCIAAQVVVPDAAALKDLAFQLRKEVEQKFFVVLGAQVEDKAHLVVALSDDLVERGLDAGHIIRKAARKIDGGGGGQKFLATAGGKDPKGIRKALGEALEELEEKTSLKGRLMGMMDELKDLFD